MVRFRPHSAKVTLQGGDSVYDQETGEYVTQPDVTMEFPCRVSPNGSGRSIKNQDGVDVLYSYLVHSKSETPAIPYGATIEVFDEAELKAKGKVIGSFSNSKNTRIWL